MNAPVLEHRARDRIFCACPPRPVLLRGDLRAAWLDTAAVGLDEAAGRFAGGFR